MREIELQKIAIQALEAAGQSPLRMSLGGVKKSGGRARNPLTGFPDLFGIIKNTQGRMWAAEMKIPNGRYSPQQLEWIVGLRKQGVIVGVLTTIDEIMEFINVLNLAGTNT